MEPNNRLSENTCELLLDPTEYKRLIGKLIYLTITRPSLSFLVNRLSQYLLVPPNSHMRAVEKILQYIKRSLGQGLFFASNSVQ